MKAAWAAAKKDFKESAGTENLKQDVKEVMDLARNKASMVKKAASSSSSSNSKLTFANTKVDPPVNQDAGAELLTHFKTEWAEIHQSTVSASLVATKMDSDLNLLGQSISRSHAIIGRCRDEFARLKDVVEALDEAQSKVERIGQLIETVEEDIRRYSQAKAELEVERRKHSLQRQHERDVADQRNKVDHLRKVLLNEEQLSLKMRHEMESKELRERQMAFQDLFDRQMEDYRTRGEVDRPIRERSQSQLEEVVIEDEDGTASLHEFLSDVMLDDNNNNGDTPTKQEGESPTHAADDDDDREEEGGESTTTTATQSKEPEATETLTTQS